MRGANAAPPTGRIVDDHRSRRRLLTAVAGALVAFSAFFIARRLAQGLIDATTLGLAAYAVLMAGTIVWARRSPTSRWPAHIMCGALFVMLAVIARDNGGSTAPAVEWFIVVAMLALFLVGPLAGTLYAVLGSAMFVLFHLATTRGWPLPAAPDPAYLALDRMASRVMTLCFVVYVGWRFAREKRDALHRSRAAREDLDAVLRNLPQGVLVTRDGRVSLANERAADMLQTPVADVVGRAIDDLMDRPTVAVATSFDTTVRAGGGARVAVRVTPVTLADPTSNERIRVLSLVDMRERQALEAQLRQAARMASLGTLAAGVAHEINNPLAYVQGNVELAADAVETAAAQHPALADLIDLLRDAYEGVTRIAGVVRDLQTFACRDAAVQELAPVELAQAIGAARRLCWGPLQGVHFECELGSEAQVLGREPDLVRVFVNLFMNAAAAMARDKTSTPTIRIRAGRRNRTVEVDVGDNGPGMSWSIRDRVFDPFFSTREAGEGMGLGLSICHTLLQRMGATILVADDGPGCTMRLRLQWAPPGDESDDVGERQV